MASEREWLPPTAARSSPVAAPRAEQSSLRNLTRLHRSTHTIRGEWKQFCSPHLFISSYSKVGVYAVFFLVEAQSYLPPSLPQGKQRGQRLSRALLPENGSQANRVGLTVGAKLAHAVQRNRLRSSCVKFTGCTRLRLPVDMILSSSPGRAPSARITRRWSTPIFRLPQGSAC